MKLCTIAQLALNPQRTPKITDQIV